MIVLEKDKQTLNCFKNIKKYFRKINSKKLGRKKLYGWANLQKMLKFFKKILNKMTNLNNVTMINGKDSKIIYQT